MSDACRMHNTRPQPAVRAVQFSGLAGESLVTAMDSFIADGAMEASVVDSAMDATAKDLIRGRTHSYTVSWRVKLYDQVSVMELSERTILVQSYPVPFILFCWRYDATIRRLYRRPVAFWCLYQKAK